MTAAGRVAFFDMSFGKVNTGKDLAPPEFARDRRFSMGTFILLFIQGIFIVATLGLLFGGKHPVK